MMHKLLLALLLVLMLCCLPAVCYAGDTVWLDSLDMDQAIQNHSHPQRNLNSLRHPLSIGGVTYAEGLGVCARSVLWIDLGHGSGRFHADVGLDDASAQGSVEFVITIDDQTAWRSGVMRHGDPARAVDLDTMGKRFMVLAVEPVGGDSDQDYADWGNAHWDAVWSDPVIARGRRVAPYILTPPSGPMPRLNNAPVYGAYPDAPVQYTIPCTGERPVRFAAAGLPPGLRLDAANGWVVGTPTRTGSYTATLTARNRAGTASKTMRWVIGERLALTPPMGWSSWNAWCAAPSQQHVLDAAHSMVKFGLIQHGFTYVNIDDGWEGPRGGKYNGIQANEKFPDFHAMLREVHGLGLKLGVYSGPWVSSYCGYTGGSSDNPEGAWSSALNNSAEGGHRIGKYNLCGNDAKEWASWGVDYLKYDWYPNEEPEVAAMANALRGTNRDIIYSVSNSASLDKGPMLAKYAELWRVSDDIRDTWPSLVVNGFSQGAWVAYSGPGHWADPDMMVLGSVGFDPDGWGQWTHPTNLTPDEQYTHMSLWCLLSAPLILGCDLTKLDPFTVSLLSNDEVLAVDQDPLGKRGVRVSGDYFHEVWERPLADGSYAVGLFNLAPGEFDYTVTPGELGLTGGYTVRDLWRQKNVGTLGSGYTTTVPGHGVVFMRLSKSAAQPAQ